MKGERNIIRRLRKFLFIPVFMAIGIIVILFTHIEVSLPSLPMRQVVPYKVLWKPAKELFCHAVGKAESLPDITDFPPTDTNNIFFLETSCTSFKLNKLFIKGRQACAVESAARLNPEKTVYLLYASSGIIKDEGTQSDMLLKLLGSYSNIKVLYLNTDRYIQNTPVEKLWLENKIQQSIYPIPHSSDILRLLTLWKFGGIYLDLDVIVVKNLASLPDNFAGAESDKMVGNAVLGFSKKGLYIKECLADLTETFDGSQWNYNGPALIGRNALKHCPGFTMEQMVRSGLCDEFHIFPISSFFLYPYLLWQKFFNSDEKGEIVDNIEKTSYLAHMWNKWSFNDTLSKNDVKVPYIQLAIKYCPDVFQVLDEFL